MDSALATTPTGSIGDAPDSTQGRRKSLKCLFGSMRSNRRTNNRTTEFDASPASPHSPQTPTRRKSNWSLFGSVRHRTSEEMQYDTQDREDLSIPSVPNTRSPPKSDGGSGVKRRKSFAEVLGTISPRRSMRRRHSKVEHCDPEGTVFEDIKRIEIQTPGILPSTQEHVVENGVPTVNPPTHCRQLNASDEGEESADVWGVKMERHLYGECKLKQLDVLLQDLENSNTKRCSDGPSVSEIRQETGSSGATNPLSESDLTGRHETNSGDYSGQMTNHHFKFYDDACTVLSSTTLIEVDKDSEFHTDIDGPPARQVETGTPDSYLQELIASNDNKSKAPAQKFDNPLSRTPSPWLSKTCGGMMNNFSKFSPSPSPDKLKPAQPTDFLKDVSPDATRGSNAFSAMAYFSHDPEESPNLSCDNGKVDDNDYSGDKSYAFTPCYTPPSMVFPMMDAPYNRSALFPSFETDPEEIRRVIELGAQTMKQTSLTRNIRPSIHSLTKSGNNTAAVLEQSLVLRSPDTTESVSTIMDDAKDYSDLENMSEISALIDAGHIHPRYTVTDEKPFAIRRRHSLNPIRVNLPQNSNGAQKSKFYPSISAARADLLCNNKPGILDSWTYDPKERAFSLHPTDGTGPSSDADSQSNWNIMNIPSIPKNSSDSPSETIWDSDFEAEYQTAEFCSEEILREGNLDKADEGINRPYEADDEDNLSDFVSESGIDLSSLGSHFSDSNEWSLESAPRYGFDSRYLSGVVSSEDVLLTLKDANCVQQIHGPTRTWFDLGKNFKTVHVENREPVERNAAFDYSAKNIPCQSESFTCGPLYSANGISTDSETIRDNWTDTASDEGPRSSDSGKSCPTIDDETIRQAWKSQTTKGRTSLWKRKSTSQLRTKYIVYRKHSTKKSVPEAGISFTSDHTQPGRRPSERAPGLGNSNSLGFQRGLYDKRQDELMAERHSNEYVYGRRGSYTSDSFYAKLDPEEAEMNRNIATHLHKTPQKETARMLTPEFDDSYATMNVPLSHISLWNLEEAKPSKHSQYWNGSKTLHIENVEDQRSTSSTSSFEFPRYNTFLEFSAKVQGPQITGYDSSSPECKSFWDDLLLIENKLRKQFGLPSIGSSSDENLDLEEASYLTDTADPFTSLDIDPTYGFPQYDRHVSASGSHSPSVYTDVAGGSVGSEAGSWAGGFQFSRYNRRRHSIDSSELSHIFSEETDSFPACDEGFENSLALRDMINTKNENKDTQEHTEIKVAKYTHENVALRGVNQRPAVKAIRQSRLPRHKNLRRGPANVPQAHNVKQQGPKPGILRPQGIIVPLANKKNLPARSPRLMTPSGAVYMPADECSASRVSEAETDESSDFGEPLQKIENHNELGCKV